jgi:hypothetical protein
METAKADSAAATSITTDGAVAMTQEPSTLAVAKFIVAAVADIFAKVIIAAFGLAVLNAELETEL